MGQQNRETLKTYFQTRRKPTEGEFADLIDSLFNLIDDELGLTYWQGQWLIDTVYVVGHTVQNDGSSYVCTVSHTSSAGTEPANGASWATYWDLVAAKGDPGSGITDSDDITEGIVHLYLTVTERANIATNNAKVGITTEQANAIIANTAKVGITTAQANAIIANTAKISFDTTSSSKLAGIESGATADQTASEIEAAYNGQVAQVSAGEKTAGTEATVRRFSPDDIKDMIDTHAGGSATDADAIHSNESAEISIITEKTSPVDADVTLIEDSAASNVKKRLSWSNIKATLKTYFDGLYAAASHTQAASTITDFDTEVANNTAVSLNTAKITYPSADASKLAAIEASADVTDAGNVGSSIHGATAKTTPVDADSMPIIDSAASDVLKKVTWSNVKATLKTYFDGLYAAALGTDDNYVTDAEKIIIGNTSGANTGDEPDSSDTVKGIVELATTTETNTGTDATRAVTPDGLAGSVYGEKNVIVDVIAQDGDLATGDGKFRWIIPATLNGFNLVEAHAHVFTASSSGTPTFQIHNQTDTQDILSTAITIDASETDSSTAATAPVINTSYDDVATGDVIRFDCDVAGTGTKGWQMRLTFRKP